MIQPNKFLACLRLDSISQISELVSSRCRIRPTICDLTDIGLHSALSPNLCAVVSISERQEVRLNLMQLPINTIHGAVDDGMKQSYLSSCYH